MLGFSCLQTEREKLHKISAECSSQTNSYGPQCIRLKHSKFT
jgi:hypothetical protein